MDRYSPNDSEQLGERTPATSTQQQPQHSLLQQRSRIIKEQQQPRRQKGSPNKHHNRGATKIGQRLNLSLNIQQWVIIFLISIVVLSLVVAFRFFFYIEEYNHYQKQIRTSNSKNGIYDLSKSSNSSQHHQILPKAKSMEGVPTPMVVNAPPPRVAAVKHPPPIVSAVQNKKAMNSQSVPDVIKEVNISPPTKAPTSGKRRDETLVDANQEQVIDMRILNYELPFQDVEGGTWKQGWDITYAPVLSPPVVVPSASNSSKVQKIEEPLQIFIVPHSHCDPGWLKTFDQYFRDQTKGIISTVVEALMKDRRRTFIWAEISYFSWWWEEQTDTVRSSVRQLLDNGQLEFVTGGWVQPDEANSELYAMEIQLQEGHDWIRNNVGPKYVPHHGWAIDPFGYSPTAAYLWKSYNFTGMLIQRVHYAVKKELAMKKHLEFFWRQTWDTDPPSSHKLSHGSRRIVDPVNGQSVRPNDIFTHVMPFYSYDVPHTCGPDPSVCCQFDFARIRPATQFYCPWNVPPQLVTPSNVKERANLLLDQYRKKGALYRSNAVLIPLGDDFRYQTEIEAEFQYDNYQLLFDYINENTVDVQIQFGTLSQYFNAARKTFKGPVPILKGSFFTYADREQDYWSGYFTSRAFDKALDRQLERILFAAETLGGSRIDLQIPRRALSLFQHHDGVTGTAKSHVVDDYAKRMFDAIHTTHQWILHSSDVANDKILQLLPADKKKVIQPCWVSSSPRDMTYNLCQGEVVVYNPLETQQHCGDTAVDGHQWAQATLPCELPGQLPSSKTKYVFDDVTGLMIEPIREEWKVWKVNRGGAYLFFPEELVDYSLVANPRTIESNGFVVKTEFWTRTVVERPFESSDGASATAIDFIYETDLTMNNKEWLVRFSSNIANSGYFHTDLNGFNFDTHRYRSDMPIQSQVFPMPTLASIQDEQLRMTVLSEHAQGTASLKDGSIDVWLDRRLGQDDNRGLGQGVEDNRRIRTRLRVLIEHGGYDRHEEYDVTPFGRRMWNELQHPLEMFGNHN
jgi:Glycosyl hydrolases family 38 N-terminal domain/Alpha mannosidase middle domain/Glycosyl hydrolases family 38 C-terminal domain